MAKKAPAVTSKPIKTDYPGIYVLTSKTDKNPKTGKACQQFYIVYKVKGFNNDQPKWDTLGWDYPDGWDVTKAIEERAARINRIKEGGALTWNPKAMAEAREKASMKMDAFWTEKMLPILPNQTSDVENWISRYTNHIKPAFGERTLSSITSEELEKWQADLKVKPKKLQEVKSKKTIARMKKAGITERTADFLSPKTCREIELECRSIINKAEFYKYIEKGLNPWDGLKITNVSKKMNGRLRKFSDEQIRQLFEANKSIDLEICMMIGLWGGLRREEIFSLSIGSLDAGNNQLFLLDTKNGGSIAHPIPAYLAEYLKEKTKGRKPNQAILPNWVNPDHLTGKFTELVDKLGFNNGVKDRRLRLVFHSLKRNFTSNVIRTGAARGDAQQVTRHESADMLDHYYTQEAIEARRITEEIDKQAREFMPSLTPGNDSSIH